MTIDSSRSELRSSPRWARLLAWYDRAKRPLPWRGGSDPYRIWISEVLLQQTRVETVIPYFERLVAEYPRVEDLARAREEDVLALWSGLGYYRRARTMLAAARKVVADGGFPDTVTGWLGLPGVGAYTAAAVCSIAFRLPVVALDGNLERVLSRLAALPEDPKSAAGRKALLAVGELWLDRERPGDSNQALMEIGATLCRPKNPLCPECPLAEDCEARAARQAESYPRARSPRKRVKQKLLAAVVSRGERFLLFRRSEKEALLAGTWELPWIEDGKKDKDAASELARRYGGSWQVKRTDRSVRHAITHRDIEVTVAEAGLADTVVAEGPEARWASLSELSELPHSSLVRKVLAANARPRG